MVDFKDPNLSFREKWRLHVDHKRRTGIVTKGEYLHVMGPLFYAYTIIVASTWMFLDILPTLYVDEWAGWLLPLRLLLLVLDLQVAGNWCGIRFVDSQYRPALHGTKPSDFPPGFGQQHQLGVRVASTPGENGNQPVRGGGMKPDPEGSRSFQPGSQDSNCGKRMSTHSENRINGETELQSNDSELVEGTESSGKTVASRNCDGLTFRMMVATSLPTADGEIERKPYPYWSWAPCLMCQRLRPPRCHHCVLCRQCVLKRDHHCYFTGRCVGVNNTRFFLAFMLWAFFLTSFGTYHYAYFVGRHMMPRYQLQLYDLVFPVPFLRCVLGHVNVGVLPLVTAMWCVLACNVISFTMMLGSLHLLFTGKTSFERDNSIKVTDTRSLGGKLRSVFGEHWWVNLLVPTYPWFKPQEDAVLWPHIKPW